MRIVRTEDRSDEAPARSGVHGLGDKNDGATEEPVDSLLERGRVPEAEPIRQQHDGGGVRGCRAEQKKKLGSQKRTYRFPR